MTLMIIDYNRTLYDPDNDCLVPGAFDLIQELFQRSFHLVLVSKKEEGRENRLAQLGIEPFFREILFVEEKSEQLFKAIRARYPGQFCYVLGDYLYQEIRAGNLAGAATIQFKSGKFADCKPEDLSDIPDVIVERLEDVLQHLTV
jgi:predicted HAD superfamily phosphohydrolase YqeG